MTLRSLARAVNEASPQQTKNSLLFEICRGPAWKKGRIVVAGILHSIHALRIVASIAEPREVHAYDSRSTQVTSSLSTQLSAFSEPKRPPNVVYHFDDTDAVDDVGALIILDNVPFPCVSFIQGAKIIGDEANLRKILQGRKFYPLARWGDLIAMELV